MTIELQITTKMQHFMAKMPKKILRRGHGPLPKAQTPLPMGRETPLPHTPVTPPLQRLSENAFGVRTPLVTVLQFIGPIRTIVHNKSRTSPLRRTEILLFATEFE